jgi:hypothetical protein
MRTLISDTREKQPWRAMCFENLTQKLDEGDYSLLECLEYEKKTGKKTIRIERKASVTELSLNLGKLFKPFEAEAKRLSEYDEKYIICEFSLDELAAFPKGSKIPDRQMFRINKYGKQVKNVKMTGKFMLLRLDHFYREYDINIIYAGNRSNAIEIMTDLLNDYAENKLK